MDIQNNLFSAIRTLKEAMEIVGQLSKSSKTGLSIGLPTDECYTGGKLRLSIVGILVSTLLRTTASPLSVL